MLAASTQQSVALAIFIVATTAWVLWILANIRRAKPEVGAEIELAPNRKPSYSDEELEGARLERTQLFGLACLVVVAVGLPLYWLAEPGRQEGAIDNFETVFASRGEGLYAITAEGGFDCAGCHGGLDGGVAPYTRTDPETGAAIEQVRWAAPALRYVALSMTEDQLREVLVYGRPYSPMPAWGLEGGGPLNTQQIDNLIAYLKQAAGLAPYVGEQASIEAAREAATSAAEAELTRLRNLDDEIARLRTQLALTPVADRAALETRLRGLEKEAALDQRPSMGAALFNVNCARCHTAGWAFGQPAVPGGGGFGPPLDNVLVQFPSLQDHIDFVTNGAEFGEAYGQQGKASGRMPYYLNILSENQIAAIVDYERSLAAARREGER